VCFLLSVFALLESVSSAFSLTGLRYKFVATHTWKVGSAPRYVSQSCPGCNNWYFSKCCWCYSAIS
jgi:hypothetical protein